MPAHDGQRPAFHQETGGSGKKKINRQMGTESPLEILLVDDNTVNVTVGKRILEMFGYKNVTSAGDGQQAVDAAEAKQYDLILLDLQMPVMDGFTAQKRLRESPLAGEPCVVALTANADHVSPRIDHQLLLRGGSLTTISRAHSKPVKRQTFSIT